MEIDKQTGYVIIGLVVLFALMAYKRDKPLQSAGASSSANPGAGFAGGAGNISDAIAATTAQKISVATASVGSQTLAG